MCPFFFHLSLRGNVECRGRREGILRKKTTAWLGVVLYNISMVPEGVAGMHTWLRRYLAPQGGDRFSICALFQFGHLGSTGPFLEGQGICGFVAGAADVL